MTTTQNKQLIDVQEKYSALLAKTNELICNRVTCKAPQTQRLEETLRLSRGKQLRPLFTYAIFDGFKKSTEKAISLAAVFESVHIASLLHDDVIDNCHLRRNLPTLNSVYGSGVAILLGDLVFVGIYRLAAELGELWLIDKVNETIHELIEGELFQQQRKYDQSSTINDYKEIISRKTAALLELCCYASAKFAGQKEETALQLKEFGKHFGIIFQMVDDWADFSRSGIKDHKDRGVDIANGFITLPWLILLKSCDKTEKEELLQIIKAHNPAGLGDAFISHLASKYQLLSKTLEKINDHHQQALKILDNIPGFNNLEMKIFLDYVIQDLQQGTVKQ